MTTFNGGGLAIGPYGSEFAEFTFDDIGNVWYSNIPITVDGNIIVSNISAGGNIQMTGNLTGQNITVTGNLRGNGSIVSVTGFNATNGNVVITGGLVAQQNITTNADISARSLILSSAINVSSNANIVGNLTVGGFGNFSGNLNGNNITVTNNATIGNIVATSITSTTAQAASFSIIGNTISSTDSTIVIDPSPSGVNGTVKIEAAQLNVSGNIQATGTLTATRYFGDGSTLSGISSDLPSGTIMMYAGTTAPTGYLFCLGQSLTISSYSALYAAIGNTFGSGSGTFNLPNLSNSFPRGVGVGAIGATGGNADAVLVSHTHTATTVVTDPGHTHPPLSPATSYAGGPNNSQGLRGDAPQSTAMATTGSAVTGVTVATTNSTEGVSAINANLPPYVTLNYIIKT